MVANNDSALPKASYRTWRLDNVEEESSELRSLLETLTREEDRKIDLKCQGCASSDEFCNCSVNEMKFENSYQIYVILESKKRFGTQWCPQSALSTNFFYCDEERTLKISSEYICDGRVNCPVSKADESRFVCSRDQLKQMVAGLNFLIYLVALVSAVCLVSCWSSRFGGERIKTPMLTERQKTQLSDTLKLISKYLKEPVQKNEENMISSIQKIMEKDQLMALIKITHKVEVRGQEKALKMFEPTVQRVFLKESQHKALFNLVKENPDCSSKMKTDVLEALESKGCFAKVGTALEKKLSPKVKITLVMLKEILKASLGLLLIPLQESKDLLTILSIKTFHQDVIQRRIHLIDNMPLLDFITILSVIYGVTFFLKLLNAVASAAASPEERAYTCSIDVLNCRFNPHWIPFLTEILLAVRTLQEIVKSYKFKLKMNEAVEQLEASENREDETSAWKKIVDIAQDLEQVDVNRETLGERKKKIKIVSCLGDILQGSVLMVLLLRTDLRVRSVLRLAAVSRRLGLDPRNGGTSGKFFVNSKKLNEIICRCNRPYSLAGLELGVTFIQSEGFPIRHEARSSQPWRIPACRQLLHVLAHLRCERRDARIPVGLPCPRPSGRHDHHHLRRKVVLRQGF